MNTTRNKLLFVCILIAVILYLFGGHSYSANHHKTITTKGRVLIIGDIHGMNKAFMKLLKAARLSTHDTVICTGDLGNKGPESEKVVEWLRKNKGYSVKGNHDPYVSLHNSENRDWFSRLPYSIYISNYDVVIVHAGIIPGVELEKQSTTWMTTLRTITSGKPSSSISGTPWVKGLIHSSFHVVFGHDARSGLQLSTHATGIDTGCVYGGNLTAVVLPSWERLSVPCEKYK